MTEIYRFDPSQCRFTVQAFATGLLASLGHNPTFAVLDFSGTIRFEDGQVLGMTIDLAAGTDSLDLLDQVSDSDRREIVQRMKRDVLESADHPESTYQGEAKSSNPLSSSEFRVRFEGMMSLHGESRPHSIDADLRIFRDVIRLIGRSPLRLSEYRIKPVTALAGAIKLKDELQMVFDLGAVPET